MNGIEKMYKNCGIPRYGKRQCKDSEYLECQNYCFCSMDNKCDKFIFEYPPFTAEKQMELIKWISRKEGFRADEFSIESGTYATGHSPDFEIALAKSINCFLEYCSSE